MYHSRLISAFLICLEPLNLLFPLCSILVRFFAVWTWLLIAMLCRAGLVKNDEWPRVWSGLRRRLIAFNPT